MFLFISGTANATDIEDRIRKIFPEAEIESRDVKYHYNEEYTIMISQWIDHEDHSKGMFKQRLFLSHIDRKAPMLMVTEGYGAGPRFYELSEFLNSNQLIVEYRYFGKSVPENMDYKYLTNQQAMEDLHRIRKAFGKIYRKEWISTGISKGGTTCMYYKATYPRDVKVAVPYVGPLPNAREDKRCDVAILSNGSDECREKLEDFQRMALKQQDSLLVFAKEYADANSLTFNRIDGIEKSVEYAVLEFTFSFWQMGHNCDEVPESGSAKDYWEYLKKVVGIDFYSDGVVNYYEPSFYQFMTQNGYYGFIHEHLDDLLQHVKVYDNAIFAPRGVNLDYDPTYNNWVRERLAKKGKRMLYIQGEYDPWGALTYVPDEKQKALLMIKEKGHHGTRMKDFSDADKRKMFMTLDKWLKTPIYPKYSETKS